MRSALSTRAVALAVVALFGFHMSRFYLAADLTNFACPHHVQPMGVEVDQPHSSHGVQGAMQHGGHRMPQGTQSQRGTQPGSDNSGMRCCCRHTLDGLITTLVLYRPADLANAPVPDGIQLAWLVSRFSFLQNDLNPPFIPPRV